jgi:heme/copper-type cytochrome/quinol oxidase subunit 2
MQMKIIVVTEKEYNDWISEQKTFGNMMLASAAQ